MGRGVALGALIAAGALMLVPGVAAATARAARPLVRSAIRGGADGAERLRRAMAEAYEHFEDIAAEARAEMEQRRAEDMGAEDDPEAAASAPDGAASAPGADVGSS